MVKERILYDNEREIEKETGIQRSKSVETTSKCSLCKRNIYFMPIKSFLIEGE